MVVKRTLPSAPQPAQIKDSDVGQHCIESPSEDLDDEVDHVMQSLLGKCHCKYSSICLGGSPSPMHTDDCRIQHPPLTQLSSPRIVLLDTR